MRIDEAKQEIESLKKYIHMIESYEPQNYMQEAMLLYVKLESVTKVAEILNDAGHRTGARKVNGKDVSDMIRMKVTDEMHQMAKNIFNRNKKSSNKPYF